MTARRLLRLFGIAMALIGIWAVAGLFTASEFQRRTIALGGAAEELGNVLRFQMVSSLNWAAATAVIIFIAERLPLRKPTLARNALILTAMLPGIAIARAVIGGIVLNLGEGDPVSLSMMELSISVRTHRNVAIAAVIIIITNLVLTQREAAARAQRELAAEALLARAEMDDLRAQLQPQFLIPALRTIAGIVETEPAAADEMVVALAAQLRESLDAAGGRR
jgi:hypothetical protein